MKKSFFVIALATFLLSGQSVQATEVCNVWATAEADNKKPDDPTFSELVDLLASTEVDRNRMIPASSMFICGVSTKGELCLKALMSCSGVTLSVYTDAGLLVGCASGDLISGQWLSIPVSNLSGDLEVVVSLPDGTILNGNLSL